MDLEQEYRERFGKKRAEITVTSQGRTELGGNHCDHQYGKVLAAAVDLGMTALVDPRADHLVQLYSAGFPEIELDLSDLNVREDEKGTPAGLIRGMAFALTGKANAPLSEEVPRGFRAVMCSSVPAGCGLSSSAAFEILVGKIFACLQKDREISPLALAMAGQYAENVYFGKPSGLMDQIACAYQGIVAVDFEDPNAPAVRCIGGDFADYGLKLAIIDTGSSHQDLTDAYAAVPGEMGRVARMFGTEHLRGLTERALWDAAASIRKECGDRAFLRALHFVRESDRAEEMAEALERRDIASYLELVKASGRSSKDLLQNIYVGAHPEDQGMSIALAAAETSLQGHGACRVHGGGFGGTIQAYVPEDLAGTFKMRMEEVLGAGTVHYLKIFGSK